MIAPPTSITCTHAYIHIDIDRCNIFINIKVRSFFNLDAICTPEVILPLTKHGLRPLSPALISLYHPSCIGWFESGHKYSGSELRWA